MQFVDKINIFTQCKFYELKINGLKVVLAKKNVSSKWLAKQLGINEVQSPSKTFLKIAKRLNLKLTALFNG